VCLGKWSAAISSSRRHGRADDSYRTMVFDQSHDAFSILHRRVSLASAITGRSAASYPHPRRVGVRAGRVRICERRPVPMYLTGFVHRRRYWRVSAGRIAYPVGGMFAATRAANLPVPPGARTEQGRGCC